MKGFTVSSQLMGVRAMVDGGMGLNFHTKELSPDEKSLIMGFQIKSGWLLFSPNQISESDIPKKTAEVGSKTPSQRLRGLLYVLWEKGEKIDDFETFYERRMQSFINAVKSKVDSYS